MVNYLQYLFSKSKNSLIDHDIIEACIPRILNYDINIMLCKTPNALEIKNAVFNLNYDGDSRLNGFGAYLFQVGES